MVIPVLLIAAARTAAASATCPDGVAIGETVEGETVCERLDGMGDLIFLNTDGSERRRVAKSYSALYDSNASEAYLGFNKSQWGTNSGPDVLGNALISRSSPGDPSCASCPSSDHPACSQVTVTLRCQSLHSGANCDLRAPTAVLTVYPADNPRLTVVQGVWSPPPCRRCGTMAGTTPRTLRTEDAVLKPARILSSVRARAPCMLCLTRTEPLPLEWAHRT